MNVHEWATLLQIALGNPCPCKTPRNCPLPHTKHNGRVPGLTVKGLIDPLLKAQATQLSRGGPKQRKPAVLAPRRESAICEVCGVTDSQLGEEGRKLMRCSRCEIAFFCSRECQKKGWKAHKPRCVQEGTVGKAPRDINQHASADEVIAAVEAQMQKSQEKAAMADQRKVVEDIERVLGGVGVVGTSNGRETNTNRVCLTCAKQEANTPTRKLLQCSRCKRAYYCDRNCQVAGWKAHKPNCHVD